MEGPYTSCLLLLAFAGMFKAKSVCCIASCAFTASVQSQVLLAALGMRGHGMCVVKYSEVALSV